MPIKTSLESVLKAKCPKCRQGNMFKYPLTKVSKFSAMYEHCPVCQLRFEVEPGFFIGAMYVSYAMTVFLFFTLGCSIYYLLNDPEYIFYLISIPASVVLLLPVIFRYSRVIYLYSFGGIDYDHSL